MKYPNIREEELKNRVAQDCFWLFDCTKIVGNIDFCVCLHSSREEDVQSLLWAEAKRGASDIYKSLVQLILTIGKARTFDKYLPPALLAAFDSEKIAFIPYNDIQELFYQNDFNWNVPPSNHETKEFQQLYDRVKTVLSDRHCGLDPQSPNSENPDFCRNDDVLIFDYERDEHELKQFIKHNFADGKFGLTKIKIDKNNFITIYNKWLQTVQPTIAVKWEKAKARGIIDGDFYLADLLSDENRTLKEKLFVLLLHNYYEFDRIIDEDDIYNSKRAEFSDNQKAHTQFWAKYERPPREEYWDFMVERRDLLVPQDIRERKGSFFTPQIWVELSQRYIADVLGDSWQDEYYIWDCAAGTGNLLNGLTNKYNIWASTLDRQDVDVMHDRIKNGANLLDSHVFQFDFLNDDFSKLPKGLQDIINDREKRKKLLIYINPPYAEAGSAVKRNSKTGVSNETKVHKHFCANIGAYAKRELFLQFFIRVYREISGCRLAEFSKLKILQAPYFADFRKVFQANLEKMFVCPADTFDNVKGQFPIGFMIWDTSKRELFTTVNSDVYDKEGNLTGNKNFVSYDNVKFLNDWLRPTWIRANEAIGYMVCNSNDFQHQNEIVVQSNKSNETSTFYKPVTKANLIMSCIYFTVRKVIPADWLNDRDQFLYPNDGWKNDFEFQNDCLAYTLFNNNIRSKYGINHWIPFTEYQVGAQDKFSSNFMTDFIAGKINFHTVSEPDLFYYAAGGSGGGGGHRQSGYEPKERIFSSAAKAVFAAGGKLWHYYHTQKNIDVNAGLYDIKEYFQGRNNKGKMNNKSEDEKYNELIDNLRSALKILAKKIEPKVYEYEFLKR